MDISRLSPFTYDSTSIDSRLIANRDYQVFDVESIIKRPKDSEIQFIFLKIAHFTKQTPTAGKQATVETKPNLCVVVKLSLEPCDEIFLIGKQHAEISA